MREAPCAMPTFGLAIHQVVAEMLGQGARKAGFTGDEIEHFIGTFESFLLAALLDDRDISTLKCKLEQRTMFHV